MGVMTLHGHVTWYLATEKDGTQWWKLLDGTEAAKAAMAEREQSSTHHQPSSSSSSDEEADDADFVVERIVRTRSDGSGSGGLEYRVKWQGYPDSENTWEPPESFDPELLVRFEQDEATRQQNMFAIAEETDQEKEADQEQTEHGAKQLPPPQPEVGKGAQQLTQEVQTDDEEEVPDFAAGVGFEPEPSPSEAVTQPATRRHAAASAAEAQVQPQIREAPREHCYDQMLPAPAASAAAAAPPPPPAIADASTPVSSRPQRRRRVKFAAAASAQQQERPQARHHPYNPPHKQRKKHQRQKKHHQPPNHNKRRDNVPPKLPPARGGVSLASLVVPCVGVATVAAVGTLLFVAACFLGWGPVDVEYPSGEGGTPLLHSGGGASVEPQQQQPPSPLPYSPPAPPKAKKKRAWRGARTRRNTADPVEDGSTVAAGQTLSSLTPEIPIAGPPRLADTSLPTSDGKLSDVEDAGAAGARDSTVVGVSSSSSSPPLLQNPIVVYPPEATQADLDACAIGWAGPDCLQCSPGFVGEFCERHVPWRELMSDWAGAAAAQQNDSAATVAGSGGNSSGGGGGAMGWLIGEPIRASPVSQPASSFHLSCPATCLRPTPPLPPPLTLRP